MFKGVAVVLQRYFAPPTSLIPAGKQGIWPQKLVDERGGGLVAAYCAHCMQDDDASRSFLWLSRRDLRVNNNILCVTTLDVLFISASALRTRLAISRGIAAFTSSVHHHLVMFRLILLSLQLALLCVVCTTCIAHLSKLDTTS